jgi:cytochrome c-type biogenesis protein CcsB
MILIYAGTWAQIDTGIWQVQKHYFHSLVCWIPFQTFFPRPKPGQFHIPGGFPMLGGYSLGLLLLINLLAAHFVRFKLSWKRTGIILIHLGLILLLVGEGITSAFQVESQMSINVGESASYSQDIRTAELAILDTTPADHDDVAAIPASMLKTGATIKHSALPFEIKIDQYFPNSQILGPMQAGARKDARATAGAGVGITAAEVPRVTGTESEIDLPSAYVSITVPTTRGSEDHGTYLVSTMVDANRTPIFPPQQIQVNGKSYDIQLRFKRLYKPYTMHLLDFKFDRYLGTDTPKDFSSYVRLVDPTHNVDREVRIWMNNPLRYNGETFFQADWNKKTERGTVLQVVRNPGWTLPYLACAIGGLGLFVHFSMTLLNFLRKQIKQRSADVSSGLPLSASAIRTWLSPATLVLTVGIIFLYISTLMSILQPVGPRTAFDLDAFGKLPVSHEGRVQPLDSLARNTLKILSGRETAAAPTGERVAAIQWLADMFGQPEKAGDYPVFRVDHPGVIGLLGLDPDQKRFSLSTILKSREKLQEQFVRAQGVPAKERDLFQRRIMDLAEKLSVYQQVGRMESLFLVPPLAAGQVWQPLGKALAEPTIHPVAQTYLDAITAYHDDKPKEFNSIVRSYATTFQQKLLRDDQHARFEAGFNHFDPFMQCIILYVTAFILAALSWLVWSAPFRRAAMFALIIALSIHTIGLISRIYISGRPPVTNLPSSAIFIAWAAVILAIGLEIVYRNGVGAACAAMLGFLSLLIADRLTNTNPEFADTLKVLQAVLDTNFWLATHVVMITLGYASTFLAGFLGIMYVIAITFFHKPAAAPNTSPSARSGRTEGPPVPTPTSPPRNFTKDLPRMIYGIVCFAILFSFIGTILGGIWADQSWGRFWGWDPKENGAVLIVLSNALLLHARWGGLVRDRGVACLAIFGNVVTAWSWFGVNMLGVGLHSYGFMESALIWLLIFVLSQLAIIGIANIPWSRLLNRAPLPSPSA